MPFLSASGRAEPMLASPGQRCLPTSLDPGFLLVWTLATGIACKCCKTSLLCVCECRTRLEACEPTGDLLLSCCHWGGAGESTSWSSVGVCVCVCVCVCVSSERLVPVSVGSATSALLSSVWARGAEPPASITKLDARAWNCIKLVLCPRRTWNCSRYPREPGGSDSSRSLLAGIHLTLGLAGLSMRRRFRPAVGLATVGATQSMGRIGESNSQQVRTARMFMRACTLDWSHAIRAYTAYVALGTL